METLAHETPPSSVQDLLSPTFPMLVRHPRHEEILKRTFLLDKDRRREHYDN
jgi:hypothetical protein